jgi:hypothetical protein
MEVAGKSVDSSWLGMSGIKPSELEKAKDEGPIGRCRIQRTTMICVVEYVMGRDEAGPDREVCCVRKHYPRPTF